jgi:predicted nucleotidyltransferase component of viral defense system
MYHHFTVETSTYQLIQEIFKIEFFAKNFALAGGTSLALQLGSRVSIDLDFFSPKEIDTEFIGNLLLEEFKDDYQFINRSKRMFFCYIKGVKCDFVYEPAKVLVPFETKDGITVYSVKDIAAMKLHTVCGRGKKKDFFDIYALLEKYDWEVLVKWFVEKYNEEQQYFLWRSIKYFEDAEDDPEINGFPPYTKNWEEIKEFIREKTN